MQQPKDDMELVLEAINQLAANDENDPNNKLILSAMTSIFINIPTGEKND